MGNSQICMGFLMEIFQPTRHYEYLRFLERNGEIETRKKTTHRKMFFRLKVLFSKVICILFWTYTSIESPSFLNPPRKQLHQGTGSPPKKEASDYPLRKLTSRWLENHQFSVGNTSTQSGSIFQPATSM